MGLLPQAARLPVHILNRYCPSLMYFSLFPNDISICTLLPRNQTFYWEITSQEKDGAVSGVGQW